MISLRHFFVLSLLLMLLPAGALRAQQGADSGGEPSELFLKAFTSVQQGEQMEANGKFKGALAKYRFAASVLEQIGQNNPNWQPLIVAYRMRKTAEGIQKIEARIALQPPEQPNASPLGAGVPSEGAAPGTGENDDLPRADDPLPGLGHAPVPEAPQPGNAFAPTSQPPTREVIDKNAKELRDRLEKTQKELKEALDKLKTAQQEKDQAIKEKRNFEFQAQANRGDAALANKRAERIKAQRTDAENELEKIQKRLKEFTAKTPGAEETRKELRDQVAKLKQAVAKADADIKAANKEKDTNAAKVAALESKNTELAQQLKEAVAKNELTKDAAKRIEDLQADNDRLTQKLADAETQIARLNDESVQRKAEVEGMQKELGTLKEQLAASRDQNDRAATTITELRTQLDDGAKQLAELRAKGQNSEELALRTKENEQLREIVMRQLKQQAVRYSAGKMVADELKRLEVDSRTLNDQVALLSQPVQPLTDEERALFKEPQITISDSVADSGSLKISIAAVQSKGPEASPAPPGAEASPGASPGAEAASSPAAPDSTKPPEGGNPAGAGASPAAEGAGPKVEMTFQPKVAEELKPMAREAKEAFDRGQYVEAEKLYDKLLAREPKNADLLSRQGVALFRQDKIKAAEVMLKKAIKAAPDDAFSQTTMGIIYYRMHRYDDAIESLTKAITLDPKNATAHNYLGITSSQKGWPEAAEDEIQKAIRLNPNYADAHFNIAVIYATNQPPSKEQAQEHYKRATELGATPDPNLEKLIKN